MPFVNIRIVREVIEDDPVGKKARIAAGVTKAVAEGAGIPEGKVWVVFEEVAARDWFVGADRVADDLGVS